MPKMNDPWNLIHNPLTNQSINQFNSSLNSLINTDIMYFNYFSNLALSIFQWENLPKTCNAEFLEWCLFSQGRACLVKDKIRGFINLQYNENSKPNIYNLPTKITGFSQNFSQDYEKDEFVICRNNVLYIPTVLFVDYFAKKVVNVEKTIDMNLYALRVQTVFKGTENAQLSLVNEVENYEGGKPFIVVTDEFDNNVQLDVLQTGANDNTENLFSLKEKYKNEFFSFIGINNTNFEKKERLLTDEVNSNNQFINLNFESMWKQRKAFAKECNKKFGLDIKVKPAVESIILENDKHGIDLTDKGGIS